MGFWSPNIATAGRIARIVCGLLTLASGVVLYFKGVSWWPWLLAAFGLFMIYEGARGWCIMRACKIRTPM